MGPGLCLQLLSQLAGRAALNRQWETVDCLLVKPATEGSVACTFLVLFVTLLVCLLFPLTFLRGFADQTDSHLAARAAANKQQQDSNSLSPWGLPNARGLHGLSHSDRKPWQKILSWLHPNSWGQLLQLLPEFQLILLRLFPSIWHRLDIMALSDLLLQGYFALL